LGNEFVIESRSSKAGTVVRTVETPRTFRKGAVEDAAQRARGAASRRRAREATTTTSIPAAANTPAECSGIRFGVARSVDVEHGLTADAALQESAKRSGVLAP
jgi:hypothetical protein